MGVIASVSSTFSFPLASGGHVGMVFGWLIPSLFVMAVAASMAELASSMPTSAGLYYFSAKLAPPKYAPLASWITGWANITGQVTLVCSIDFTCAQMITSAIAVGSGGSVNLGSGATYGILLAILATHGLVCSAATRVLARLNLFYVVVNGRAQSARRSRRSSRCWCARARAGSVCPRARRSRTLRTTPGGRTMAGRSSSRSRRRCGR